MVTKIVNPHLSAVSNILHNIAENINSSVNASEFSFYVADNLFHRLNAYRLGYSEYLKKGFIESNEHKALVNTLDTDEHTMTFVAYHGNREVGTLTVNTQENLPFQEIFSGAEKKINGFKGAELTRLAIDEDYRNHKEILLGLFNLAFIYSRHIRNRTHFVIEVNPRHVKYYQKILGFIQIAEHPNCPRVKGAPAVLLFLDLALHDIIPEKYPFLSIGKEQKELIHMMHNTAKITEKEIEIIEEIYQNTRSSSLEKEICYA